MRLIRTVAAQLGLIQKSESRAEVVARMRALKDRGKAEGATFIVYRELALTTFFPWVRSRAMPAQPITNARTILVALLRSAARHGLRALPRAAVAAGADHQPLRAPPCLTRSGTEPAPERAG